MIGFLGHHKCATMWIFYITFDIACHLGLKIGFYKSSQSFNFDFVRNVRNKNVDYFACINADHRYVKLSSTDRAFHVIRDPRDIAVSAYFSHLRSHPARGWPELTSHRKTLRRLSAEEGLIADMEFCKRLPTNGYDIQLYRSLFHWDYSQPNVMEVRYEDLVKSPVDFMIEIFRFLGWLDDSSPDQSDGMKYKFRVLMNMPLVKYRSPWLFSNDSISSRTARKIIADHDYVKKTRGRSPGHEDINHHYRKGMSGDWKNYFTDKHKEYFKANFNELLIKLGYEQDEAW